VSGVTDGGGNDPVTKTKGWTALPLCNVAAIPCRQSNAATPGDHHDRSANDYRRPQTRYILVYRAMAKL
jgi:hypothetical protein